MKTLKCILLSSRNAIQVVRDGGCVRLYYSYRRVVKAVFAREQAEGAGARVKRSIGTAELRNFDPFLMLDLCTVAKPAGFPKHPHRGFQTVSYLLPDSPGTITHADFCGHMGTLKAGDVQWMDSGRGILHSEIPGDLPARGLQLWVNSKASEKLSEPNYQEISSESMPRAESNGVKAVVIAGQALGVEAKIFTKTPIHYIHFTMEPGAELIHPLDKTMNAFLFGLSGTARIGDDEKVYMVCARILDVITSIHLVYIDLTDI